MFKLNEYDLLADLDIDTNGNDDAKTVKSWIDALSDGEYLSKYDYSESIVNDAVSILERLNLTTFVVCDRSGLLCQTNGFDYLLEKLSDYPQSNEPILIHAWGEYRPITIETTTIDYLDDLDIYQLIKSLDF